MTDGELQRVSVPTMFCWGTSDPFLAPARARRPSAGFPRVLHEVPAARPLAG